MVKSKRNVVTADSLDKELLMNALESQGNVIPASVAVVVRMIAPILARIAIRYVARIARKKISDATLNSAARYTGMIVGGIIQRAAEESTKKQA